MLGESAVHIMFKQLERVAVVPGDRDVHQVSPQVLE